MMLDKIEQALNIKIYNFYNDSYCLAYEDFLLLNQEMRSLALLEFGLVPEYQCFIKDYKAVQDKIIVIHRNVQGELDGFASGVIVEMENKEISNFMHLGVFIVSPAARHMGIQLKLGLGITAAYLFGFTKNKYWITNVSSVLGTLSIVDKMYLDVYPGLKKNS